MTVIPLSLSAVNRLGINYVAQSSDTKPTSATEPSPHAGYLQWNLDDYRTFIYDGLAWTELRG
jgi:hypothetical protein